MSTVSRRRFLEAAVAMAVAPVSPLAIGPITLNNFGRGIGTVMVDTPDRAWFSLDIGVYAHDIKGLNVNTFR